MVAQIFGVGVTDFKPMPIDIILCILNSKQFFDTVQVYFA